MALVRKIVALSRKEHFWIVVLTLLTLAMHFSIITAPDTIILDETYYVNDARDILAGDAQVRGEHLPLGTLLVAGGIRLFGDNSLGWRGIAVVMGSASVLLFYLICRRLRMPLWAANVAAFLYAFEVLTFTQSSVAMLDVYSVFFMLFCFWLYLRGDYPLAALLGCLAVLAKVPAALGFVVIILHWLLVRRDRRLLFWGSMVLAPVLFTGLLPVLDVPVTGYLTDPVSRVLNLFGLGGRVTFAGSEHEAATRPWMWLLLPRAMPYNYDPDYLAIISPTVWALIIPSVVYMAWRLKRRAAALFGLLWFAVTYLVWIPADLLTDRMTFVFYFYPAIGAVCIGIALGLARLRAYARRLTGKRWWPPTVIYGYLGLHMAVFVLLSPVFARWLPSLKDIFM